MRVVEGGGEIGEEEGGYRPDVMFVVKRFSAKRKSGDA